MHKAPLLCSCPDSNSGQVPPPSHAVPRCGGYSLPEFLLRSPGQTVYVKGISYEQAADTAHVLAGKNYLVRLLDVNRKELVQKSVDTNEFGSFTTEFVLPAVCLNGNFMVEVKDKAAVPVRVEDYKRSIKR